MTNNNNFILSGRYQILRVLGHGSDGTVYLARHQSLEVDRAIKVFPKNTALSVPAISEANILKAIRHPGIPMIYDLEEDECNYYLVEEYIHGESLSEFLLYHKSVSPNLFFKFCEQLCDIFQYLHTIYPSPVLYQDLKPEHIIVCGLQLRLIDFSVSSFITNSADSIYHFGNREFSAPELCGSGRITLASDIYSIGRIMEYMSTYVHPPLSQNILTIIQKATNAEPDLRYETVGDLYAAVQHANDNMGRMHLRQTIAVLGSYPGCGATHIAVSLVCMLNALGQTAVYYEKNSTDSLRKAVPHMHNVWNQNGCYISGYFKGYPLYGDSGEIRAAHGVAVIDYGCHIPSDLTAADTVLLVCGGALWHRSDFPPPDLPLDQLKNRLHIVANLCDRASAVLYARRLHAPVYLYPYDTHPFRPDRGKKRFAQWLFYRKKLRNPLSGVCRLIYRLLRSRLSFTKL